MSVSNEQLEKLSSSRKEQKNPHDSGKGLENSAGSSIQEQDNLPTSPQGRENFPSSHDRPENLQSPEEKENSPDINGGQDSPQQADNSYPKQVFFIIGNEFCERYTFYGLRTVLYIYFTRVLLFSDHVTAACYHSFATMAYFFPIAGAIIADSCLGKFKTILYLSIVYAIGCFVLAGGSFRNSLITMRSLSLLGLFIISFGTGGIKPCVSAFGGDQFKEGQERQQQKFFSMFYMAINLGSIFASISAPILREDVKCCGQDSCFPLTFGVPATLMVIAILLFVAGKPLYVMRPSVGNIVPRVTKCIFYALGRKIRAKEKKLHWLDHADDKFDKELINDTKVVLRTFKLYLPLPVFWALFDQIGSRWTQQAELLDGDFFGLYDIKPDQMQAINSVLVVFFIPLFEYVIYPIFSKMHVLRKPLTRITVGGILGGLAFVCSGTLQLAVEGHLPKLPPPGHSEMIIINNSPCRITLQGLSDTNITATIQPFGNDRFKEIPNKVYSWRFVPEACGAKTPLNVTFNAESRVSSFMVTLAKGKIIVIEDPENKTVSAQSAKSEVKLYYNLDLADAANASFKLVGPRQTYYIRLTSASNYGTTLYSNVSKGSYKLYAPIDSRSHQEDPVSSNFIGAGGKYVISVYNVSDSTGVRSSAFQVVEANRVSILYQFGQYVVITAGEILLSISGLEFSYSQAPRSMKSVVQAAWQATTGLGNLLVVIISGSQLFRILSYEMFFYAGIMFAVMLLFAVLAYYYEYTNPEVYERRKTSMEPRPSVDLVYTENRK